MLINSVIIKKNNYAKKGKFNMKLISWNVNGIRACLTKGFADFFKEIDADIFCLQETKCQPDQVDLEFEGYKSYWNSAEKKGYSGTAIFTKKEPLNVVYTSSSSFKHFLKIILHQQLR